MRSAQKHGAARYLTGIAYRGLVPGDGPRRLSVRASQAEAILTAPEGAYDPKVRAAARQAYYHDPSVKLQRGMVERVSLHDYPLYREHDENGTPIGKILHSCVDGDEVRIWAKVWDPAVVAEIDAGTLPDFSIGYDFDEDALGRRVPRYKEVSLVRNGFFSGTNVLSVTASGATASGGTAVARANKGDHYIERAGALGSHSAVGTLTAVHLAAATPPAMSTPSANSNESNSGPAAVPSSEHAKMMEELAAMRRKLAETEKRAQSAEQQAGTYRQTYAEQNQPQLERALAFMRGPAPEEGKESPELAPLLSQFVTEMFTNPEHRDAVPQIMGFVERAETTQKEAGDWRSKFETVQSDFETFRQNQEAEKAASDSTPSLGDMHQPSQGLKDFQSGKTAVEAMKLAGSGQSVGFAAPVSGFSDGTIAGKRPAPAAIAASSEERATKRARYGSNPNWSPQQNAAFHAFMDTISNARKNVAVNQVPPSMFGKHGRTATMQ